MATIDTSTITGYADMTAEQKLAALEGYTIPDADYTGYVKKDVFDKTASDLAALKKKAQADLTEEQKKALEAAENMSALQAEVEGLRKDKQTATLKANFLGLGYDDALATEIAQHTMDGATDKVFDCQQRFLKSYKQQIEKDLVNATPPPAGGNGGAQKQDYAKMANEARMAGNMSASAYYTRLGAQAEAEQKG